MSQRAEAAYEEFLKSNGGVEESFIDAIAAADQIMFSEAAIERAAQAMQEPWSSRPWDQLSEDSKDVYRNDVRAVVAALREGA